MKRLIYLTLLSLLIIISSTCSAKVTTDVSNVSNITPTPISRYGAVPGYGNLRSAILAARTAGVKSLVLQEGTYTFSGGAIQVGTNFSIKSTPNTIINCVGSVFLDESATGVDNSIIDGGRWVGDGVSTFLKIDPSDADKGLSGFQLKNCTITGFDYGLYLPQAFAGNISSCKVNNNRVGAYVRQAYDFNISGGAFSGNASYGLDIGGAAIEISSVDFSYNHVGIQIATTTVISVQNSYFELNSDAAIRYTNQVYSSTISGCLIQTPTTGAIGIDTDNGATDTSITLSGCFFDGIGIPFKGDTVNKDEFTLMNLSYASGIGSVIQGASDFLGVGRSGVSLTSGGSHLVSFNRYLGESAERGLVNIRESALDVFDIEVPANTTSNVTAIASFSGWLDVLATGSLGVYYVDNYTAPGAPTASKLDVSSSNFVLTPYGSAIATTSNTIAVSPALTQIVIRNNYGHPMRLLCRISKKRL